MTNTCSAIIQKIDMVHSVRGCNPLKFGAGNISSKHFYKMMKKEISVEVPKVCIENWQDCP